MRVAFVLMLALLGGCGDPIMILPGGKLSGTPAPVPADWSEVDGVKTIQVEFRLQDPYSHNIWGVGIGPDLYIATGAKGTRWTPFVAADPNVVVRVGTNLYDLRAVPVTGEAERARVAAAYVKKYDVKAEDNWVAQGMIFRLDRRS
jgi:hypothetical protein